MWPFKSKTQKKKIAIQHIQDLIDYREGIMDASAYLGEAAPKELLNELAREWFFLLKTLKILKEKSS